MSDERSGATGFGTGDSGLGDPGAELQSTSVLAFGLKMKKWVKPNLTNTLESIKKT